VGLLAFLTVTEYSRYKISLLKGWNGDPMITKLKPATLRSTVSVADPFAPVRLAPVSVNGESVAQVGVEILNDDDRWECINIHSQGYQLISNSLAQQTAREITSMSSLNWTEEKTIWTGRFLSTMYRSDQIVEVPAVGDAIALGLRVENSYDGSAKFRLVLMAYVLSCTNGLMSPRHFSTYTVKHTAAQEFDLKEAVSVIHGGVRSLEQIAPRIATLSRMPLDIRTLASVANSINLPGRDWGPVVQNLGNADSVWDLMQEVTHRLTFNGKGRALITTSEQVGDFFLGTMADRLSA